MTVKIETGRGRFWRLRGIDGGRGSATFGIKIADASLNFLITVGDELLVVAISGERLFKSEDVFGTIVTDKTLGDGFHRCFDPIVPQFNQFFGVGIAGHY